MSDKDKRIEELEAEKLALLATMVDLNAELAEHDWISVEDDKPKAQVRVAIAFKNAQGNARKAMAEYVPYRKVLAEDFISDEYCEFHDYDKENDVEYAPEGFYEYNFGSEICMHMPNTITHWKPLHLPAETPEPKTDGNLLHTECKHRTWNCNCGNKESEWYGWDCSKRCTTPEKDGE